MKLLKRFLIFLIIFLGLFFIFTPNFFPENLQLKEFLDSSSQSDVFIIFNSGGWGNTPLEKAEDFAPIIEGIQGALNGLGYNSLVIPYIRTKNNFLGKTSGARDFLNSFQSSSEILAEKVEFLTKNFPDKKIIMAGLSSGGALVEETMEKISAKTQNSVYTIAVGTPFWLEPSKLDNVLQLDNERKDSLAAGDIKTLIFTLVKAPFKWISSKINGESLTFSQALQVPGHDYFWSSPKVGPQIVTFLKNKFR